MSAPCVAPPLLLLLSSLLGLAPGLLAQPPSETEKPSRQAPSRPAFPKDDRIRLAEAFRLADTLGEKVWQDWNAAPFAVLLVTPEAELLLRHPQPGDDFTFLEDNPQLRSKVWYRARRVDAGLPTTFTAIRGVPTIVVGEPEKTEAKSSTRWVLALLHEHFHQLQEASRGFSEELKELGPAPGDEAAKWRLDYSFPYSDSRLGERFAALARVRAGVRATRADQDFESTLLAYIEARRAFFSSLPSDDAKHLELRLWKEGIARYTELRLAELAAQGAEGYQPSRAFRDLADYQPFIEVAGAMRTKIEAEIRNETLSAARNDAVDDFGAAEGLLLDRARPFWHEAYFANLFRLEPFYRFWIGTKEDPPLRLAP